MYMECVQPHPETAYGTDIINLPPYSFPPAAGCSLKILSNDLPLPEQAINTGIRHEAICHREPKICLF